MTIQLQDATAIEELSTRYGEAWNSQDLEAILALHSDDSVFHLHVPGSEPAEGKDAIREAFAAFLTQLPDINFATTRLRCGADFWVLESKLTGTVAAPIEIEGESVEGQGARIEVDFIDAIEVRDGLVSRKDSYLDGVAFERQMGAA